MTANADNLTPQQRLAQIVAEETDGGRRVVRFFMRVADGELDHEGFQPNHRMDAAKQLVKVGLTAFQSYIDANPAPQKPRKPRRKASEPGDISPEVLQAREELAQYARELTGDGRTVIRMYSEVMHGFRNDEGFKPHHRIAAGRELLRRGFGPASAPPEPAAATQITDHHENQTNHSSDQETHPAIVLTPAVSEYLSDAVEAYEERNPIRELMPQRVLDIAQSDAPLYDCPCMIAEREEGRDIPCPENEECPYYDIEWPKHSEEDRRRIEEQALRGLRMRAERLGLRQPSEEDP